MPGFKKTKVSLEPHSGVTLGTEWPGKEFKPTMINISRNIGDKSRLY